MAGLVPWRARRLKPFPAEESMAIPEVLLEVLQEESVFPGSVFTECLKR